MERSNRLDWVLLLPSTLTLPLDDVIVIGGTDAMAQSLVDGGVARRWRRPLAEFDRSLLTIGWADAPRSVEQMAQHVAPGGVLVTEIERRRTGRHLLSARAIERRLLRSGLVPHSIHVVEPSFSRPGRYLPVDAPRALRWYLRTLFVAGTPKMKLLGAAMSAVVATPLAEPGVGASGSRLLVIAVSALAGVGDAATRDHPSAPLGAPDGRIGDRAIVLTSGYDAGSRAVMLLFGEDERAPREVVKVASGLETAEGTVNEHSRLARLHGSLPRPLTDALPMPLQSSSVAGRIACVQSCAPGPSMSALVGRWGSRPRANRARLAIVSSWLTELALATRTTIASGRCEWVEVLTDLPRTVPLPQPVARLLGTAEEIAVRSDLVRHEVHQHYDTGPWNIHLGSAGPFLVDWEHDRMRPADCLGPPLADLLYFATYWYFLAHRIRTPREEEQAVVRLFAEPVPADQDVLAVRQAIDRSLAALGLSRRCVPAALVALWAERTLYTQRRRHAHGEAVDLSDIRAHAYLSALAGAPGLFGEPGWWSLPLGANLAAMDPARIHTEPGVPPRGPAATEVGRAG